MINHAAYIIHILIALSKWRMHVHGIKLTPFLSLITTNNSAHLTFHNILINQKHITNNNIDRVRVMVFNATFNNISVISWLSVLLVEETRVCGENHRSVAVILLLWNFIEIILKEKNKSSVPTEHCVLLNKHQGILNVVFSQININTSQNHFFKIKLFTEISPNKMA